MKTLIAAVLLLGAAACGDQPAPKPAPAPAPQALPQPITPAPAPAPQAKAPEAPKPDPNQELAARVSAVLQYRNPSSVIRNSDSE